MFLSQSQEQFINRRNKIFLSKSGVPPNIVLFGRTVTPNSVLFGGTVPPNSFPLFFSEMEHLKGQGNTKIKLFFFHWLKHDFENEKQHLYIMSFKF